MMTNAGPATDTMLDLRDRALLTMGMMGAFRRSELVRIRVGDIAPHPRGLSITIPFSKGDQTGVGQSVAILEERRIEPVHHLRAWIEAAEITAGAVFRRLTPHGRVTDAALSEQSVALVVKKRAAAVGYDPALFAGHSLRACFLTEAGRTGATLLKMQEDSRHKSIEMPSTYVRDEELSATMLQIGLHDGVWELDADKRQGLQMMVTSPEIGR